MVEARRILKLMLVAILFLGLAYPFAILLEGRLIGAKAEGDIVSRNGQPVGAEQIGQAFSSDTFFHGRPSAAGNGYDAMASGGSNLGPTSPDLRDEIQARIEALLAENPGLQVSDIPVDLVTASASGLDPEISEQAALIQVPRVSLATSIPATDLVAMVKKLLRGRWLGIFGESGVNVLQLNLAVLDKMKEVNK
jgi:K+-transporting ATPase ATPase C chain